MRKSLPKKETTNSIILKISISTTIQVKIQTETKSEEIIQPIPNKLTYPPTLYFDNNEISIEKRENKIDCVTEFLENMLIDPMQRICYHVTYQHSRYELITEEIFALYFYLFVRIVKKKWKIKEVQVEMKYKRPHTIIS